MFSLEEAEEEGPNFYTELAEEVREECEKVGQVAKVTPLERHKQGIVCVKFKNSSSAEECIQVMDGRYFAGRTVEASFYDGKTDLRVLGTAQAGLPGLLPGPPPAPPPASAAAAAAEDEEPVAAAAPGAATAPAAAAAPVEAAAAAAPAGA